MNISILLNSLLLANAFLLLGLPNNLWLIISKIILIIFVSVFVKLLILTIDSPKSIVKFLFLKLSNLKVIIPFFFCISILLLTHNNA